MSRYDQVQEDGFVWGAVGWTLELCRGWSEIKGWLTTLGPGHRGPRNPLPAL